MGQRSSQPRENFGSGSRLSSVEWLHKVCPAAHDMIADVNDRGQNSLQTAIIDNDVHLVKEFLDITVQRRFVDGVIMHVDEDGLNSLQYAIIYGSFHLAETLLQYLSDELSKYEAVSNVDSDGNNFLQLVFLHCDADTPEACVELVLTDLFPSHLNSLITHNNSDGQNALVLAMSAGKISSVLQMQQNLSDDDFFDNASLIMSGDDQKLMITWAVEHEDNRLLRELTVNYPSVVKEWLDQNISLGLSTQQIGVMAPVTDTYIIPAIQTRAKKYALVCYNPSEREGADTEAHQLTAGLEESGFSVHVLVWTCYADLRDWIAQETDVIKEEVSILALFIMSHGNSGILRGQGSSFGQISVIIDEARNGLPLYIPLLVGVQACQITGDREVQHSYEDALPVAGRNQDELNHVIFTAKNSVLIMATVYGESAYRHNFTSAFSEELNRAKDKHIYEIYIATQRRMKANSRPDYQRQWLDFRVVGSSKLRL